MLGTNIRFSWLRSANSGLFLVYNEVDERLYAVDQAVQGLLRIRLTSINVQQTFR